MLVKQVFESRKEWLAVRRNHIGGSEASACMGLHPYKNNVQLWEEKTGLIMPEDISYKDYVQYGTEAEVHLRALFALDYPQYRVDYEENNMFTNTEYPYMHASLDGELTDQKGRKGILEIKTANIMQSIQSKNWDNQIPDNYFCQVLHYLAVTGWNFVVLKAQLKYAYDDELRIEIRHYLIEREEVVDSIRALIDAERKFWTCVENGRRPDLVLPPI